MSITTESVRADYVGIAENVVGPGGPSLEELRAEYGTEFDAWLAGVKAEAWDEGFRAGWGSPLMAPILGNPHRVSDR